MPPILTVDQIWELSTKKLIDYYKNVADHLLAHPDMMSQHANYTGPMWEYHKHHGYYREAFQQLLRISTIKQLIDWRCRCQDRLQEGDTIPAPKRNQAQEKERAKFQEQLRLVQTEIDNRLTFNHSPQQQT